MSFPFRFPANQVPPRAPRPILPPMPTNSTSSGDEEIVFETQQSHSSLPHFWPPPLGDVYVPQPSRLIPTPRLSSPCDSHYHEVEPNRITTTPLRSSAFAPPPSSRMLYEHGGTDGNPTIHAHYAGPTMPPPVSPSPEMDPMVVEQCPTMACPNEGREAHTPIGVANVQSVPPPSQPGNGTVNMQQGVSNTTTTPGASTTSQAPPTRKRGRKANANKNPNASGVQKEKPTSGRYHWDLRSQVALVESKKAYDDQRKEGNLRDKFKTAEEQWKDISTLCAARGVIVDWKQAYDKWKRLYTAFREISDWERNIPSGKSSYWQMNSDDRLKEDRFSHLNFDTDLFELMERLFGIERIVDPTASVVDTSGPQSQSRSQASPAVAASDDAASFEQTTTNSGVQKKAKSRTHRFDVGLDSATKDLMKGFQLMEKERTTRQDTVLDVQKEQHNELVEVEKKKLEISMLFAHGVQGMSEALKKMADKL